MATFTLYFKIHLAECLGSNDLPVQETCWELFDEKATFRKVNQWADCCGIPVCNLLHSMLEQYQGEFRFVLSISGNTLAVLKNYRPDVIQLLCNMVKTGWVEILGDTYYHSLCSLYSQDEFRRQVIKHSDCIREEFGYVPAVFCNTELIYNNTLASCIAELGYEGILCEGLEKMLKGRSPNHLYRAAGSNMKLLLRNVRMSDDISFRFDDPTWNEQPLTSEKFASWVHGHGSEDSCHLNVFLDLSTFGYYKKTETGILDFLACLPAAVLSESGWKFETCSGVLASGDACDVYDVPRTISWEGRDKENCVWCENTRQNNTLKKIFSLERMVRESDDQTLLDTWGRLQEAEYYFNMAGSKKHCDPIQNISDPSFGENFYKTFVNVLTAFEGRLINKAIIRYGTNFHPSAPMAIMY